MANSATKPVFDVSQDEPIVLFSAVAVSKWYQMGEVNVTLDVPGLDEPATGRFISLPRQQEGMLNDLFIRHPGHFPDPQKPAEALVNEAFADANQIQVQDHIGAILNGRWQELDITGLALSPEYIYAVAGGGSLYPDDRRFGILWLNETALAKAFDLDGAFNSVALTLMPGANETAVITQLDNLLDPYGGLGAYGRSDQVSHRIISDESEVPQLASLKLGLPTTTQFKDGLICLRDFPLHPPLPPKAKLILV
ncbi:MAG: hypothetical protein ABEI32_07655 [Halothece sp.]